jgi:vacuole morphology and inheritance protein 14
MQLAADLELSVKNGAELLDRLIKDIVAESAASYVSVLRALPETAEVEAVDELEEPAEGLPTAFSLENFLPLLEERINVVNPFTRTFLVAWITLLDSIPDLELITYLPRFLDGLFRFLSDPNQDVHTATQVSLDRFLNEIKKIARVKRGIAESRKSQGEDGASVRSGNEAGSDIDSVTPDQVETTIEKDEGSTDSVSAIENDEKSASGDDWIPGQDVQIDYSKVLDILVKFLGGSTGKHADTLRRISI